MPVVQLEANLTEELLLQAVKQMNASELDAFAAQVLSLRARRQAPSVSKTESELLFQINQGFSKELGRRYQELIDKRQRDALTPQEHAELLALGDQFEQCEAERMQAVATLAQLRQSPLAQVMHDLGLGGPVS